MKAKDHIFTPKNNTQQYTSDCANSYYTILGEHDFLDDNDYPRANNDSKNVLAKCIIKNDINKFYIKVGTYGRIFNPMGMFSEGKNQKFIAKIGKKEFEFKEVNQKVFNFYTKFLATKNLAWLNNAEREMV